MKTHGTGQPPWEFAKRGDGVVLEEGVLVFHPENITLGSDVYVGHQTILKAYYRNEMRIGSGVWIGQQCFFHSAGGIEIEDNVGIGPGVRILTSQHQLTDSRAPIMHQPLSFAPVRIGAGSDIGVSAVILPGVTLGNGVQVAAGAVVKDSFPDYAVIGGVPAKLIRIREVTASEM
ncbi:acyltransferase [Planctomicrobium piriforme]|uniref:Acetyltransferase (Isoleucine patch superfamily) n=1 Tax=Planctomicrobium piriforme TaxID=1576369 RepID=A0A1I3C5B8_9PLAN|nr:acyltransferase [Planctomicrobium piriforme]SFH69349.1 Acetyltransferase (isoleucine patch superfamily) [Planctomicrobium piriforme]